jgi:hypothetical protein
MKFALFYEIPVAQPWAADSEHRAFKNTLEQAVLGEQAGFDSVLPLLEPRGALRRASTRCSR